MRLGLLALAALIAACYLPETYVPSFGGQVVDGAGHPAAGARVGIYALPRFVRDGRSPSNRAPKPEAVPIAADGSFRVKEQKNWHWYLPVPDGMSVGWHAYVTACSADGSRIAHSPVRNKDVLQLVLTDGEVRDDLVEQCAMLLGQQTARAQAR